MIVVSVKGGKGWHLSRLIHRVLLLGNREELAIWLAERKSIGHLLNLDRGMPQNVIARGVARIF